MRYTTQKSIGKIRWNTKSMQLIQRKEDKKGQKQSETNCISN